MIKPESESIRYLVTAVTFRDENGNNCTEHSHVHAVDTILKKYIKYESFFLEDKIVSVLWSTPASFDKYLHILADDIVQSSARILNLRCSLGASRVVQGFTDLSEAYRMRSMPCAYAGRSGQGGVRYIIDEESFSGVDMDYVMKVVANIEEKIKGGAREELESYLWRCSVCLKDEEQFQGKGQLLCWWKFLFLRLPDHVFHVSRIRCSGSEGRSVYAADGLSRQLPEGCFRTFCSFLHGGQGSDR